MLLALLNWQFVPEYRRSWLSDPMLVVSLLLFAVLCINELRGLGG